MGENRAFRDLNHPDLEAFLEKVTASHGDPNRSWHCDGCDGWFPVDVVRVIDGEPGCPDMRCAQRGWEYVRPDGAPRDPRYWIGGAEGR